MESVALPVLWAAFLALLIAGPWLAGGYIFGTDWPGPRRFGFPTDLSSSAPVQVILSAAARILSAETTGKLIVFGELFVAALTAYRALPRGGFVARAVASAVYLLNPFVWGRLHYGQLFVLAGYAVLPWVALTLHRLLLEPRLRSAVIAAVSLGLLGVLIIHLLLIVVVLGGALVVTHFIGATNRLAYVQRLAPNLLLTIAVTLVVSAYWAIPLLLGTGLEGARLASIGPADAAAFAVIPDHPLGLLPNLLGLYGFWAEGTGRFTSMKEFVPLWPTVLAIILLVGAVGTLAAFKHRRDRHAQWVAGLVVAALLALVLEMGVSHPMTSGLVLWLDLHFAVYRGMRDAGKWAALLALVYSQLFGLGAIVILDWLRKRVPGPARTEWAVGVATGLLLAFPLYYGNGLLFGMHGEIKPSQYPPGWYAADRVLAADSHPGRALFLPWHEYMALSFVRNQNSVVASPAPTFFSIPVVVSADPGVPGIAPPNSLDQRLVTGLVQDGSHGPWAALLATIDVKYILVAREVDWRSFIYLDNQPGLVKVGDFGSILLYRNSLVT